MDLLINQSEIENKIYILNGLQFMLDKDLAGLFQTETRTLKQAVKRNIVRFPADFMFEMTDEMVDLMVSQSVIPSKSYFGGAKPYAFTEQGIAMLSSIIKTSYAVQVSIQIIRAFVEMRKMLATNNLIDLRFNNIEKRLLETDQKFEQVFKALESKDAKSTEHGIFFDGQIFDAYTFVSGIIRNANSNIVLIDNYIDETVLTLLTKRKEGTTATIHTKQISRQLQLDLDRHNAQYPRIEIKILADSHDRFLLIDNTELYHIGASLKDLGKKWFAFSKMDDFTQNILNRIA